jgi:hypothetical protein
MKRKYFMVIIMVICATIIFKIESVAQTIKTPMNQTVYCLILTDPPGMVAVWEADAADWIDDHNSNAVRIDAATQTYNCHGYAWHKSDGGSTRWINQQYGGQNNLSKYWTNDAYSVTSHQGEFEKVYYGNAADHSAITTSTSEVKSKWGRWPLYRHLTSDCPYSASNLTRYNIPITGVNCMCDYDTETYTTKNISGASYSWSGYKLSTSGSTYSVNASSSSYRGLGYIMPQISNLPSGTTIKSRKYIWIVGPDFNEVEFDVYYSSGQQAPNMSGTWLLCPNTTYHIYLDNNSSCTTSNYVWTIPGAWTKWYQYNNMISINTNSQPGGQIMLDATTCCAGCGSVRILIDYMGQYWDCGGGYYMASPNPADSYLDIDVNEEKIAAEGLSIGDEYVLTMVDKMGTVKFTDEFKEFPYRINTKDIPDGLYIINLIYSSKISSIKVIIEH